MLKLLERKEAAVSRETGLELDIDTKALTDQGEFEGYASIFGNVDRGGDIVVSGAFAESLRARPAGKVDDCAGSRERLGGCSRLIRINFVC